MATPTKARKPGPKVLSSAPSRGVDVNGLRVHYKKVGTGGPVLLLAHGWACDHSFWRYQAERFHEQATLLCVDLPGHGRSDKPHVAYTHDLFADALRSVLDDAGEKAAVVVGHSAGGSIVREFHRRFPERARALVLVDASLRPFWKEPQHLEELLTLLRGPDYLKAAVGLVEMMLGKNTPLIAGVEIRLRMLTTPQHVMLSLLEEMAAPALWADDPLDLPVQALLSRASRYPEDYEAYLRRLASRLDLRWLDRVGHFMMLDAARGGERGARGVRRHAASPLMRLHRPALLTGALAIAACARTPAAHVVTVEVAATGSAARAGLQAGDVLASWERGQESGPLASPFAVAAVETEQAPRGPVTLRGRRGWRSRSWTVPVGTWGLETRPPLDSAGESAAAAARREDGAASAGAWHALAGHLDGDAAAWAHLEAGRAWLAARRTAEAMRSLSAADKALGDRPAWRAVAADQAGDALRAAGAWVDASSSFSRALELRTVSSARSLGVAKSRYELGRVARRSGDFAGAAHHLEAARSLLEELAPDSPRLALAWHELGATAFAQGRLDAAMTAYGRALAIQERSIPESLDVVTTLSALGGIASQRSEFAQAEELQRRALALVERLAPDGMEHAYILNRLGVVAREQGDLDEAEALHRRGLAVFEKASPHSVEVAGSLNNLGLVAQARLDWVAAEGFHRRALALRETLQPDSGDVAASLNNLGAVARERGDFVAAEPYLRRALDLKRKRVPGSLTLGVTLHNLGEVLLARERYDDARACLREAAELRGRLAPGSGDVATDWHSLGLVDRQQGRAAAALGHFRRALDLMDAQRGKLGGGDRAGFSARYAVIYQDAIELLLERGQAEEAFAVRERLQARAWLSWLGHRSPAGVDEPRPLDAARARAALDPGVALLGYGILRRTTAVFVVRGPGLPGPVVSAFVVPQGAEALRDRVVAFRGLVERGRETSQIEPALAAQGERLYVDLVKPAEAGLAAAERILISPDGPLHLLPFGALVRRREPLTFLAEWKPLPTVASASVYAALKRTRRAAPDPEPQLAAFGDPLLPPPSATGGDARSAAGLRALPFSREEVERIAALFGGRARRFTGSEATEARARSIGRDVRYLHFATHGLLDARAPLDSALVLSRPPAPDAGDDGLLQAWEVRDRIRLDADLVTLSACESGLGREATAEGLIGLARAFQHAGARSVLASLWAIPDRSTAPFMESFYRRVRSGLARDRALQEAQVESLRQGAPPYQWAAFQLSGDWQ